MRDRRREHRTSIDLLVNKYISGEPHLCRAVNLSRRGMLLHTMFEPDVPRGEVMLEFPLPGLERVVRVSGTTLAEHRWARAQGIRFTHLDPEDAVLIDVWLDRPDPNTAYG